MNPIPLFTILVLCVIIAFILADKKMVKESKQKDKAKISTKDFDENEENK